MNGHRVSRSCLVVTAGRVEDGDGDVEVMRLLAAIEDRPALDDHTVSSVPFDRAVAHVESGAAATDLLQFRDVTTNRPSFRRAPAMAPSAVRRGAAGRMSERVADAQHASKGSAGGFTFPLVAGI